MRKMIPERGLFRAEFCSSDASECALTSAAECLETVSVDNDPVGISISLVSHGHATFVAQVMADLTRVQPERIEVILTLNIPEPLEFDPAALPFPVRIVRNAKPRGFAANNNSAAALARHDYFCVLNPDVRLSSDPFPPLIAALAADGVGVTAPVVYDSAGRLQDSARQFPTLESLTRKALAWKPRVEYLPGDEPFEPDWVAGVFMLFRTAAFRRIGGFDERYFLYYEDVDMCARLRRAGFRVVVEPKSRVIHDARRSSWRRPYHTWLHLKSAMRFLGERGAVALGWRSGV